MIEIIVVLVILAILAAIAVPSYMTYLNQGIVQNAENNFRTIAAAQQNFYFSHGCYCGPSVGGYSTCMPGVFTPCYGLSGAPNSIDTLLNLNIVDNNFSYGCSGTGAPLHCWAIGYNINAVVYLNMGGNTTPTITCYSQTPLGQPSPYCP